MSEPLDFLSAVRARLQCRLLHAVAARTLLAIGGLGLLWAVAWRIPGYAAPRWGYAVIVVATLVISAVAAYLKRPDLPAAALSADRQFDLKDALLSWLGFRHAHREEEVYALQEKALKRRLDTLDPAAIPAPAPGRIYGAGIAMTLAAAVLACLPHSEAVRARLAQEEETLRRSGEVKKQLQQVVEEMAKEMSAEDKKELDPAKLLEMAKQMKETKDQREAEKQLARFEQQLAKAMQGMEMRQDEAVMKLAADELSKSSMPEARQLGKMLDAKDFEAAKEALEDIKPDAKREMTAEEMKKLQENAEKMKEMSKRMADGSRKRDFGKSAKPGKSHDGKPSKEGKDGQPDAASDNNEEAMQDMLEDLDEESSQLEQKLEDGDVSDEDQELSDDLDEKMDGLTRRLSKMNSSQKMRNKMKSLRGAMGGARQFSQGQSQSLSLSQAMMQSENGGKPPGTGSAQSRRDAKDELKDNNNRAEVKGQANGDGPSTKTVETAESGTGVAGRAAVDRNREFKQQLESMVRRDDVPEDLKLGVREYFERVHETGTEESTPDH